MSNRTTVKSNILTKNVPTVTNAILSDILNAELADNLVFGEDVAVVQTSTVSSITCDFTSKDRIDLTRTGGALAITLSGIGDGETKYLLITKTAGQVVTFVGTTDVTPIKANANALSTVLYEIVRKSSFYFAKAWVENVKTATDTIEGVLETATQTESNALAAVNKIVTPGRQPIASTTQIGLSRLSTSSEGGSLYLTSVALTPGAVPNSTTSQRGVTEKATATEALNGTVDKNITADLLHGLKASDNETRAGTVTNKWTSPAANRLISNAVNGTFATYYAGTFNVVRDTSGNVHLKLAADRAGNLGVNLEENLGTIPVGYRPSAQINIPCISRNAGGSTALHYLRITSAGLVYFNTSPTAYTTPNIIELHFMFHPDN